MANATNVRGPYPNLPVTTGIQTYYVDERLGSGSQIGRKIILTWQSSRIVSATCTCTPKASLSLPCSHIQSVLNYIGITTSVAYTPRQISARAKKGTSTPKPNSNPISTTTTKSKPTKSIKSEVTINNNAIDLPDFITDVM